jgi:hypothetical protein
MARQFWVTMMRWDVLSRHDLEEELRLAHALIYDKLAKRTKAVLAMPERERNAVVRQRKRILAEKAKAETGMNVPRKR